MARAITSLRALARLPLGIVRAALVVRIVDEWWSYLPAGAIGDLRRDLGITYTQAGWLLALLTVGGLVGGPLGALADRGHRRLLSAGGASLIAAALAVYAAGAPFAALAVASTVLGGASDLMIRPLETSLAQVAGDDLDRALGRQHLLTWGGDLVGPAVLALGAATWLGWRGAFALTAAAVAAYALALATVQHPDPVPDDGESTLWGDAVRLARSPRVLLLVGAEVMMLPLDEAFLGFAVARLTAEGRGAAAQSLAVALVVGGLAGAGAVARRGLGRSVVVPGTALLAVGALTAAASPWLAAQLAGMAALGAGTAVAWARVHHRTLTVAPDRASTVATVVSVLSTPSLVLPAALGGLADAATLTVALVAGAALTVPLAAIVLALGDARPTAPPAGSTARPCG